MHGTETVDEMLGRDKLLNEAHRSLTIAYNLANDYLEDKFFIQALDCLALASHTNHKSLVKQFLVDLRLKIEAYGESIKLFELEAENIIAHADKTRLNLYGRDKYTAKPFGFGEQRLLGKMIIKRGEEIKVKVDSNGIKFEVLNDLYTLSFKLSS